MSDSLKEEGDKVGKLKKAVNRKMIAYSVIKSFKDAAESKDKISESNEEELKKKIQLQERLNKYQFTRRYSDFPFIGRMSPDFSQEFLKKNDSDNADKIAPDQIFKMRRIFKTKTKQRRRFSDGDCIDITKTELQPGLQYSTLEINSSLELDDLNIKNCDVRV